MVIASFLACLLVFLAIGLASMWSSRHSSIDYLMAGRSVPPWLVALSAVATNNSGYMFIGLIGYTWSTGVAAVWMMLAWIAGDLIASLFIHRPLREATERSDVHTFSGLLARWHGGHYTHLRRLTGLITLIFLGAYAAAQLSAGSKALQVLFGWEHYTGALLGAVIVLAYSAAGGIRASIWTDAAQSLVMIVAMGVILMAALEQLRGPSGFHAGLAAVGPEYLSFFPATIGETATGVALFIGGWLFAGFGVVGQPHIMIRFMAMDDPAHMGRVRLWYYGWFLAFWCMALGVGLASRLLLPEQAGFDAELALPSLAQQLLPDMMVGLVLAGIFAATISTTDSLILSCSAALTRDFHHQQVDHFLITKLGTVLVTAAALGISLAGNQSVFELVLDAWGVLACAFAPLLTVYALRQHPSEGLAIAMVLTGVATMYGWSLYGPAQIYAVMPGILMGLSVFILGRLAGQAQPALRAATES